MTPNELANRLEELGRHFTDQWRVDKEPHPYPDGTTHFNHVRFTTKYGGEDLQVVVASYATPDLAELPTIITALRASST